MSIPSELHRLGVEPVAFNTNNAWGFGGGIGHEATLPDGSRIRYGTAYFRHARPRRFARLFLPDEAETELNGKALLRHLEALATPPEVTARREAEAQQHLVEQARELTRPSFVQGNLFYDAL